MIPKRIFFYWGGEKMSWMRYMTLYSFRKFNPDWEMVLYLSNNNNTKSWNGPEEQDFSNYRGDNYLDKISDLNIEIKNVEFPENVKDLIKDLSPIHESDLFRYYELFRNGGLYCDMDVLFFRPIDEFYGKIKDYDSLIHQDKYNITIGFLGSCVNNLFYKNIFSCGIFNNKTDNYQSLGVDLIYKIYGGNRIDSQIYDKILNRFRNLKFYNLDTNLIYKYDWTKIDYNFSNPVGIGGFSDDSIGYHWYGGSPISQKYNNLLNETNYMDFKTTFSELCKNIM